MIFQTYITAHTKSYQSGVRGGSVVGSLTRPQEVGKVRFPKGRKSGSQSGGGREAGHSAAKIYILKYTEFSKFRPQD